MPRSKTRIKICVKKREQTDYNPSIKKLKDSDNFNSLELLKICRYHKINVHGSKKHLCDLASSCT